MEQKINIAELLKDCPSGMELDCAICDNVYFDEVTPYMIRCYIKNDTENNTIYFHKDGSYLTYNKAKCVIYPKGKTTWEGFVPPCKFEDGDILTDDSSIFIFRKWVDNGTAARTYCALHNDGYFENGSILYFYIDSTKHATDAEKAKLFQAIKDNGYEWNPETKTLKKLVEPRFKVGDRIKHKLTGDVYKIMFVLSNGCGGGVYNVSITNEIGKSIEIEEQDNYELDKFDITTLKPFESRVLVRTGNRKWVAAFYSHYDKDSSLHYCAVGGLWHEQCIPYEGNEHLLGTTNDCCDYYKTWEN